MTVVVRREIAAPPEQIYDCLLDFGAYADWNPWIVAAAIRSDGSGLVDGTAMLGPLPYRFVHAVVEADPPHAFTWIDLNLVGMLADGVRSRYLEPTPGGSRYTCVLSLGGRIEPLVSTLFNRALAAGMVQEADALKQRCERR